MPYGSTLNLGFETKSQGKFSKGQPIIMRHPSGIVINVLGPANQIDTTNILQDVSEKYAGFTHIAIRVPSLEDAEEFMNKHSITITERLSFGSLKAFFIRDPDGNVIELDEYPGEAPSTRQSE